MTTPAGIRSLAEAWLAQDPDPQTRAELAEIVARVDAGDEAAEADLHSRFATRLAFGTAGLRGELGAGSNRMNRVLVIQAAAGLAAYLRKTRGEGEHVVVVGYDGRRNSDVFARDSAEILAGAGFNAVVLPRALPTPVLAFAVRRYAAAAGVMVTASHNPPNDNGYKVYLGATDENDGDEYAGAQIVPPADAQIAAEILTVAAGDIRDLPRADPGGPSGEDVVDAYVAETAAVAAAPAAATELAWVYTAMHGVGWETLAATLDAAGYPRPTVVTAQIEPDGAFPTVAFPNPEEPGAMDLALETARSTDAELVIANDPDADRLAVAIPDPDAPGGWRLLTGNQVGLLLGWRAARLAAESGEGAPASLACSLVSSPGLAVVAAHYGLAFHETLTGFKWISRAPGLVFGFEEALGYLVNPSTVRDKDGISAAIAILGIACDARARGESLADVWAEFSKTFGAHASGQVSLRVEDLSIIARAMASLRAAPPEHVGGLTVTRADDLLAPGGALPPGDVLRYSLAGGSRLIVRPSGTEPKLKLYLDVRGTSDAEAAATLEALHAGARELLAERTAE